MIPTTSEPLSHVTTLTQWRNKTKMLKTRAGGGSPRWISIIMNLVVVPLKNFSYLE